MLPLLQIFFLFGLITCKDKNVYITQQYLPVLHCTALTNVDFANGFGEDPWFPRQVASVFDADQHRVTA
jgi:hypothetical protein